MIEKDRSKIVNKTYQLKMLLLFYQKHVRNQLNVRDLVFLKILVILLQSIKIISIEKLANALPLGIKFESRRKRIQRFLSLQSLTIENIWFPIIASLMETYFETDKLVYIAIVNYRGRIGWVSRDFICTGNSSQPVGRGNSRKCNTLLASIKNTMRNNYASGTIKGTHDYRYSPVNRPHFIYFQMGASGEIGNRAFRKSIASQIIYNCKTVGIVKYGAFISSGGYVDQVFGLMPSGKVVQFKCLYGRRRTFKPRWGQAKCSPGENS